MLYRGEFICGAPPPPQKKNNRMYRGESALVALAPFSQKETQMTQVDFKIKKAE